MRVGTNIASKFPEDYHLSIIEWLRFNQRKLRLYLVDTIHAVGQLPLMVNMDQTPLPFGYLSGRACTLGGDKTVWAKAIKSGRISGRQH